MKHVDILALAIVFLINLHVFFRILDIGYRFVSRKHFSTTIAYRWLSVGLLSITEILSTIFTFYRFAIDIYVYVIVLMFFRNVTTFSSESRVVSGQLFLD